MESLLIFVGKNLLLNIITGIFFLIVFKLKYSRTLVFFSYVLIITALEVVLFLLTESTTFPWWMLLINVFILTFCLLVSTDEKMFILGCYLSHIFLLLVSHGFGETMTVVIIKHLDIAISHDLMTFIIICASYLAQVTIYPRFLYTLFKNYSWNNVEIVIPTCIFQLIVILSAYFMVVNSIHIFKAYFLITMFFLFVVMDIILLIGIKQVAGRAALEERYKQLEEQRDMEYDYIKDQVSRDERYRKFNHDMRNNLATVHALLQKEKDQKGLEMFNDILEDAITLENQRYSENAAVDALFNFKKKTASENQIGMEIDLKIPEISFIKDIDLCNIFSNLLDNAIEACIEMNNEDERWIKCKAKNKAGVFIIHISNSYTKSKNAFQAEKKKLKKWVNVSGLGLTIIKDISKRYNGTVEFNQGENVFEVTVLIPIM